MLWGKRRLSLFSIFLLLTTGFIGFFVFEDMIDDCGVEAAKTIIVDKNGGGDYTSIQNAISNADPGDTIRIWAGTYTENLVVSKSLSIIGNGSKNTIVNGGSSSDVVAITANWVNISGISAINSGQTSIDAGIDVFGVINCRIEYCNCTNNYYGIYAYGSHEHTGFNIFNENECYNNQKIGIYIRIQDENLIISNNTCNSNLGGIVVENMDTISRNNITIINNTCNSNNGGIGVGGKLNNYTIINNKCFNNYDNGIGGGGDLNNFNISNNSCYYNIDGIDIWGNSNNYNLSNNLYNMNDRFGIYVGDRPNNINISNNICNQNNISGIYLNGESHNVINNTCNQNNQSGIFLDGGGIFLDYGSHNVINNTCKSNAISGIYCLDSNNNIISNNTCSGHYKNGIYCKESNHNTITNNNCTSNSVGIYCEDSDDNEILDNNCTSNVDGIYCWYSDNNKISNNTLYQNFAYEISIRDSNYNQILGNNCSSNKSNGIYCWDNSDSNIINNNNCYLDLNESSSQDFYGIAIGSNCDENEVINNTCESYHYGIQLGGETNLILNNKCNSNYKSGIYINMGINNEIINNTCNYNNENGINIHSGSNNNLIQDNTCNYNNENGIYISGNLNTIFNNTCNSNHYGLLLSKAANSLIKSNTMSACSISIEGNKVEYWNTHSIDTTNSVNNKPVYYWKNQNSGVVPKGAGEVILANCQFVEISKQDISNGTVGILLGYTNNSVIINSSCSNNYFGIQLFYSKRNIIDNCSIRSNLKYDLDLEYYTENNIALNSTFDTIYCSYSISGLIIKNYLHIQAIDTSTIPVQNADVEVKDGEKVIYSSNGISGNNSKTNEYGQIKWIAVTDRTYSNGINRVTENITTVYLEYPRGVVDDNNREINMSTSHFETFIIDIIPNHLPDKIILQSPLNNSYFNYFGPIIKWKVGFDEDGDPLTYYLQIDEFGGDWESLIWSDHTSKNELQNFYNTFTDGNYQWRVCANDGFSNGSWSDIWKFTIDTTPPKSEIFLPLDNGIYKNLVRIIGQAIDPKNGTGINNVKINIKRLRDNLSWDGVSWGAIETWLDTSGANYWFYDTNIKPWVTDTYYNIRSRAADNISNIEIPGPGVTFMYDDQPPDISIVINDGDKYTNSSYVILSIIASDSGSGLKQIAFSTDDSTWSAWELFNSSKFFDLSAGDGGKTVYFKARDKVNNTAITSDMILLDTTPPDSLSIVINLGGEKTNSTNVTLNLNAVDALSGVDRMAFSNDGVHWGAWESYMNNISYTIPSGDGFKIIYFRVKDKVGNIAEPVNNTINLNTSKPPEKLDIDTIPKEEFSDDVSIWIIVLIIIFILIIIISAAAIMFKKRKNRLSQELSFEEAGTYEHSPYYDQDTLYEDDFEISTAEPLQNDRLPLPSEHVIAKSTQTTQISQTTQATPQLPPIQPQVQAQNQANSQPEAKIQAQEHSIDAKVDENIPVSEVGSSPQPIPTPAPVSITVTTTTPIIAPLTTPTTVPTSTPTPSIITQAKTENDVKNQPTPQIKVHLPPTTIPTPKPTDQQQSQNLQNSDTTQN